MRPRVPRFMARHRPVPVRDSTAQVAAPQSLLSADCLYTHNSDPFALRPIRLLGESRHVLGIARKKNNWSRLRKCDGS